MQPISSSPSDTPSVLLLDDDLLALEELEEIVELEGWTAHTAATVQAALDTLERVPGISIVVTDVHLVQPDGTTANGVSFVADARQQFPQRNLSFIVQSGDVGAIGASIETGIVDFLPKPLMADDLIEAIRMIWSRKGAPGEPEDLTAELIRKVEQQTEALQRMASDLVDRESEISEVREGADRRRRDAGRLRRAIEDGQIVPWLQPQICAWTGRVTGFEALIRWIEPDGTPRNPAEFLPMAVEAGMMQELDRSVQRQALEAHAHHLHSGHQTATIGLNITAGQLADRTMVDQLMMEIDRVGLSPGHVSIEILESAMLDEDAADPIKRNICRLVSLGFGIALDDFGTGHSSLSSLRDLPISQIKIDRSFVAGVHDDVKLQKFTRALIALAKALDIDVLAEGIECQEELDWLRSEGCGKVQGFSIARPMPCSDALRWAAEWSKGAA